MSTEETKKEENEVVAIRRTGPGDERFILNSWLRSFEASKYAGILNKQNYRDAYTRTAIDLLSRPQTRVHVACTADDPDQILGYMISEDGHDEPVIHYIYVKEPFRRLGIATRLFTEVFPGATKATLTFRTRGSDKLKLPCRMTYNAWFARKNKRKGDRKHGD